MIVFKFDKENNINMLKIHYDLSNAKDLKFNHLNETTKNKLN